MSLIKKIRIQNFKSLEDVEIEIKPLTFFFGPNSSGKSSFLKAMMFLSKNMFPLNTGKTIYKISDDVDLGSYKDIVSNNDITKNIVFEFDLEGEFEFPKKEVYNSETFSDDVLKDYLAKLDDNPFFSVFHKIMSEEKRDNFYLSKEFLVNVKTRILFKIELKYFENECNIFSFSIYDKINNSTLLYTNSVSEDEYASQWKVRESQRAEKFELSLLGNENITKLFEGHINISGFYEIFFHGEIEYGEPFLDDKSIIPNLPSKNEILSDKFNLVDSPFRGSQKNELIWKEWENYSNEEKVEVLFEVIKFTYIFYRLIPDTVYDFFMYKHLPTTREIPKSKYILTNGMFEDREYYGFLNYLKQGQNYFENKFASSKTKVSEKRAINNLIKGIKVFSALYKGNKIKKNDRFLKLFISLNRKTNLQQLSIQEIEQLVFLLMNYYLNALNFKFVTRIKYNCDIGSIYLYGDENKSVNLSGASSGLIQIFPILISCILNRVRIFYLSDLKKTMHFEFNPVTICFYKYNQESRQFALYFNTLLIEQPELHLHPKLQSQLAGLFADTVKNANNQNTLIIETHSEHLIRKIQVSIAKGELDREKVGVWYFDNNDGATKIKEMIIEPNGFFKEPWPNGFFDDSANLSWELLTVNRN